MSGDDNERQPGRSGRFGDSNSDIVHTIDDETTEAERRELLDAAAEQARAQAAETSGSAPVAGGRESTAAGVLGESRAKAPSFWDPMRVLAAAATGASMWISAPDMNVWWLAFVGWVPLLWAIHERPPRHAFFYGWISGFVSVFVGFFWMTELLTNFAGFGTFGSAAITAVFALWLGLQWAIPAWLCARLCQQSGRSTLLIFPAAWAAIEFVLPSIFPVYMGFSWAWHPLWIQTAEIGGAMTVSFVMVAINAAVWELLRGYLERGALDRTAAVAFAGWMLGVPAYGAIRIAQIEAQMEAAPKIDVGVVQGNFGIETYSTPGMKLPLLRELQRVTAALQDEGAEVVLWGETAYPYARFTRQHPTDLAPNDRHRIQRGFDVPVIVGLVTHDATGKNRYAWNTAWVLDADGRWGDRYDKNYPLMFGEAAPPGIDPDWYTKTIPSASHLNRGDGPAVLEAAGYRFGPLICYEDILPRFTREVANEGVNAIVNLTNDSWFGKTREQAEHLGLAVFRAIEHRKPLLRSVNAGISAYVDPTGRVIERTETTDSDNDGYQGAEGFVVEVPMMPVEDRTAYGITGDLFGWLCIAGLFGVWGWSRYRRAVEHDGSQPSTGSDAGRHA